MNHRLLVVLLVVAVVAALAPPVLGRVLGVPAFWASTLGIIVALLAAYPAAKWQGRVSLAQWATVVAIAAVVAVTAELLMR